MVKQWDTTTTNGKIRVMQAAESGKPLQRMPRFFEGATWIDAKECHGWDWLNNDYRIRPEPREFCLTTLANGIGQWTPWHEGLRGTGIHVREVIA